MPSPRERVGDLEFHFLAGDFFQNNPFILPLFTDYVAQQASMDGEEFLVDAYCGSGLFALSLAKKFKKCWAWKSARLPRTGHAAMPAATELNMRDFWRRTPEPFCPGGFPRGKTAVVIDPPRKGCSAGFLAQLFAFGPGKVVYVSCNPATQIRDLAGIRQGRVCRHRRPAL